MLLYNFKNIVIFFFLLEIHWDSYIWTYSSIISGKLLPIIFLHTISISLCPVPSLIRQIFDFLNLLVFTFFLYFQFLFPSLLPSMYFFQLYILVQKSFFGVGLSAIKLIHKLLTIYIYFFLAVSDSFSFLKFVVLMLSPFYFFKYTDFDKFQPFRGLIPLLFC